MDDVALALLCSGDSAVESRQSKRTWHQASVSAGSATPARFSKSALRSPACAFVVPGCSHGSTGALSLLAISLLPMPRRTRPGARAMALWIYRGNEGLAVKQLAPPPEDALLWPRFWRPSYRSTDATSRDFGPVTANAPDAAVRFSSVQHSNRRRCSRQLSPMTRQRRLPTDRLPTTPSSSIPCDSDQRLLLVVCHGDLRPRLL